MLAPIYLLLLGEHGPVGPVRREFVRLASPITTTVALASGITTSVALRSPVDLEDA